MKYKEKDKEIEKRKKEYMDYKLKYLDNLKIELQNMLDIIGKDWHDKKFNDLLVYKVTEIYKSMKALAYFPEYELPE